MADGAAARLAHDAVRRRLRAVIQAVVAQHLGDAHAVVLEDLVAAGALGTEVGFHVAPLDDGFLVAPGGDGHDFLGVERDRKSTRLNSSHSQISYAVFCLKKKKNRSETFV